jgi:hypothetical protein
VAGADRAAVDVAPVVGADKVADAVLAAQVDEVRVASAEDDVHDVKRKIQVSSSALSRSEGYPRSSKAVGTSHLTQWS